MLTLRPGNTSPRGRVPTPNGGTRMWKQRFRVLARQHRWRVLGAAASAALLGPAFVLAFATPASGHEPSGVEADCDHVTVHFSHFDDTVPVHIVAHVGAIRSTG